MEIFVSAGETSSDIHSAKALKAFSDLLGISPKIYGLGGAHLLAAGAELLMENSEFSVMGGPLEVIGKIPKRRCLEKLLEKKLLHKKPDFAFLVDNGEINLRLASLLHFFKVPVVYFIPPKVWVWRSSRIEQIKNHVQLVLSILPFEEPIYKEWEIPFQYVGNPIDDEVPFEIKKEEAIRELGLDQQKKYISIFPGSRHSEVRYHIQLFAKSLIHFSNLIKDTDLPEILIPVAPAINEEKMKIEMNQYLSNTKYKIHFFKTHPKYTISHLCLRASEAAIVKSGTSTLEAAALEIPMVLSYDSSSLSKFLFKHLARYKGFIGMANLFLVKPAEASMGFTEKRPEPIIPELILDQCKPELISEALYSVYHEGAKRNQMLAELKKTRSLLRSSTNKSPVLEIANSLKVFCEEQGIIKKVNQ